MTDEAIAAQGWDDERAQRVREYLEHRSEEQYGAWIEDLAAHGLDDDSIDGDEVVFPDGYDRLASHLAEGLDVRLDARRLARAMVRPTASPSRPTTAPSPPTTPWSRCRSACCSRTTSSSSRRCPSPSPAR